MHDNIAHYHAYSQDAFAALVSRHVVRVMAERHRSYSWCLPLNSHQCLPPKLGRLGLEAVGPFNPAT